MELSVWPVGMICTALLAIPSAVLAGPPTNRVGATIYANEVGPWISFDRLPSRRSLRSLSNK